MPMLTRAAREARRPIWLPREVPTTLMALSLSFTEPRNLLRMIFSTTSSASRDRHSFVTPLVALWAGRLLRTVHSSFIVLRAIELHDRHQLALPATFLFPALALDR